MFSVKVGAEGKELKRLKQKLTGDQARKALRMALNDGVNKGRVMVRRSIQDIYNIKSSRINDSNPKKGVTSQLATNSTLTAYVNAGHIPVNLINMQGTKLQTKQTGQNFILGSKIRFKNGKVVRSGKSGIIKGAKTYAGAGISVEIFRGQRKTIASAFTIGKFRHFSSGRSVSIPSTAVFARGKRGKPGFDFGSKRMPIDSISTVSVATAARNAKAVEKYSGPVNDYTAQRFKHHVKRLIDEATRT